MDKAWGERNVLLPFSIDVDHQAFVRHVKEISDHEVAMLVAEATNEVAKGLVGVSDWLEREFERAANQAENAMLLPINGDKNGSAQ
jgi:hypothetical protein